MASRDVSGITDLCRDRVWAKNFYSESWNLKLI